MLFAAFFDALHSLRHRSLLRILLFCVITAAVTLIAFIAAVIYGLHDIALFGWHLPEWVVDTLGGIGASILAWFLFPALLPLIAGLFAERIAGIIETNDYPDSPPAIKSSFKTEFFHDLRFVVKALLLNLLCLPLYLIPGINLLTYYSLNAYLLGREFFEIAARRRIPLAHVTALRQSHTVKIMMAGLMITLAANMPMINLVAPFFAIAVMVHLSHRLT